MGNQADEEKIVIVVPCDSTDAWTAAAYEEDVEEIETIADPWDRIISIKKEYHGIRIPGHNSNTDKPEIVNALIEKFVEVL